MFSFAAVYAALYRLQRCKPLGAVLFLFVNGSHIVLCSGFHRLCLVASYTYFQLLRWIVHAAVSTAHSCSKCYRSPALIVYSQSGIHRLFMQQRFPPLIHAAVSTGWAQRFLPLCAIKAQAHVFNL